MIKLNVEFHLNFCVNKKRNGKNDESNPNNDSGANQINNSNDIKKKDKFARVVSVLI